MDTLYRFMALVRADLLERLRSNSFWLVLALTTGLTVLCFPALDSGYLILGINGHFRGFYSSAWVGMVVAMLSVWLSLVGFFMVRGTLRRDIDGRVFELLAVTPMSRFSYLLAKWSSHMLVLGLVVLAQLGVGVLMQFWRGEDSSLQLLELVRPSLLIALPSLAWTATLAVAFDMLPWLRRTAGNVVYLLLWLVTLTVAGVLANTNPVADIAASFPGDPRGILLFQSGVTSHLAVHNEDQDRQDQARPAVCMGCGIRAGASAVERFEWKAWQVTPVQLAGRGFWLAFSLCVVLGLSFFLDRAAAHHGEAGGTAPGRLAAGGRRMVWLNRLLRPLQRGTRGQMLAAELQITLRQRRLWWWPAMGLALALQAWAAPRLAATATIGAWVLLLDVFSRTALRDQECNTGAIVFSAPRAVEAVRLSRWMLVVLLACVFTLPAQLRFLFSTPLAALAVVLVGASLATWGLALSCLTRNARAFELVAGLLAYLSVEGAPVLNVVVNPQWTIGLHALGLPLAALLYWFAWSRLYRTLV